MSLSDATFGGRERPMTRYARSDDGVYIAYQVFGEGPRDIVVVHGLISHLDVYWDWPIYARFMERLATFARVIVFDKRGVGLSDRVPDTDLPGLERRMDDVRAVMDAAGSEQAVLFGISEGAPMSLLFAATYPQRVPALILHGAMPRTTADDDYPFAAPRDAFIQAMEEWIMPHWDEPVLLEVIYPSLADDPQEHDDMQRRMQASASPSAIKTLVDMALDIDVRDVLPTIQCPTLVLHRRGDRAVSVHGARWMAEQIPGARLVEVPGQDHLPWVGDQEPLLGEIEEFLTGVRGAAPVERMLLTVLFSDIVDSTGLAARLGDDAWTRLLEEHNALVRRHFERFQGREVGTRGDGFLAVFDGPGRAVRCAQEAVHAVRSLGMEVRAGLHTGEVEVRDGELHGLAVHIGARVGAMAGPGEVLVSRTVKDLTVGSDLHFEDRGVHELRGVPDEWQIYAVVT